MSFFGDIDKDVKAEPAPPAPPPSGASFAKGKGQISEFSRLSLERQAALCRARIAVGWLTEHAEFVGTEKAKERQVAESVRRIDATLGAMMHAKDRATINILLVVGIIDGQARRGMTYADAEGAAREAWKDLGPLFPTTKFPTARGGAQRINFLADAIHNWCRGGSAPRLASLRSLLVAMELAAPGMKPGTLKKLVNRKTR